MWAIAGDLEANEGRTKRRICGDDRLSKGALVNRAFTVTVIQ